ncbi:hypothetical protein QWT69_01020 [Sporosarcina oncorhynchi]|uniref:Uncharacterized protein n=1 Tax=Sporosarcina oncorhynchi TaxID=3056444 RepID=A0ABZ0L6E1_9BACL|nr:hypothetical protein [Sporosarcina sp. T2O-4]WOV87734.1 hypothetical protein QWT69_01020 [Sporosarcina sp. T2O-4]
MKKRMALTALGLGAAYLMRNKNAREKLADQFDSFGSTPMRGEKSKTQRGSGPSTTSERNKGILGGLFN